MVKLSAEICDIIKEIKVFYFGTSSKDGVPNVAPMGMVYLQEDKETIWLIDNYMNKTMANMLENPVATIPVWHPDFKTSYQLKGTVTIENEGKDYENAVSIAHFKSDKYPAKHLIKFVVKEVYTLTPGEGAGERVL